MYVTLNQLKEWNVCADGYKDVLEHVGLDYGKDKPINLSTILKSNDFADTMWCVDNMELTPDQERDFRLLACGYADRVLPIFEKTYPDDDRPRLAIEAAKQFANGEIDDAAWAAARDAARDAAGDAAGAAGDDGDAAMDAAWAARSAARDAAGAAARDAAWAARAAAWAAGDAARAAEQKTQEEMLIELLARYENET